MERILELNIIVKKIKKLIDFSFKKGKKSLKFDKNIVILMIFMMRIGKAITTL